MALETRPCPHCSEPVNVRARKCRHCKRDLGQIGAGGERDDGPVAVSTFVQPGNHDASETEGSIRAKVDGARSVQERVNALYALAQHLEAATHHHADLLSAYEDVLRVDPAHSLAHEKLQLLCVKQSDIYGLVVALERELGVSDKRQKQMELRLRIAFLAANKLEDYERAYEHVATLLADSPEESGAESLFLEIMARWESPTEAAAQLYEKSLLAADRWADILTFYDRCVSSAASPSLELVWREKLHVVLTESSVADPGRALTNCMAAVRSEANRKWLGRLTSLASELRRHDQILPVLDDLVKEERTDDVGGERQAWGALARLLERQENWPRLVSMLRKRADETEDPEKRTNWLERAYELATETAPDAKSAYAICKDLVLLRPGDAKTIRQLQEHARSAGELPNLLTWLGEAKTRAGIAGTSVASRFEALEVQFIEESGDPARLAQFYVTQISNATSDAQLLHLLPRLLDLKAGPLQDPRGAYQTVRRLAALDPGENRWLERLLALANEAGTRGDAVTFLRMRLNEPSKLGTGNQSIYRNAVADLLELEHDWQALDAFYKEVIETAKGNLLQTWQSRLMSLQENQLEDVRGAFTTCRSLVAGAPHEVERWKHFLTLAGKAKQVADAVGLMEETVLNSQGDAPTHERLLQALLETLEEAGEWEGLVGLFQRFADQADDVPGRLVWLERIHSVRHERMKDFAGTFAICKTIVRLKPEDGARRLELFELATRLERVEELVEFARSLRGPDDANDSPTAKDIRSFQEKLLISTQRWQELLDLYKEELSLAVSDDASKGWHERIHTLQKEHLGDAGGAFEASLALLLADPSNDEYCRRALADAQKANRLDDFCETLGNLVRSDRVAGTSAESPLRAALAELLRQLGAWDRVARLYRQNADAAGDVGARVEWLSQLLSVQKEELDAEDKALATCKEIIQLVPAQVNWAQEATSLARSLDSLEDLAEFAQTVLDLPNVGSTELRASYEQWLETLLSQTGNWAQLVRQYQARAKASNTASGQAEWLLKVRKLQNENLQDAGAGYETCKQLVRLQPGNKSFRETLSNDARKAAKQNDFQNFVEDLLASSHVSGTPLETTYLDWRIKILEEAGDWGATIAEYRNRAQSAADTSEKVAWLEKVRAVEVEHLDAHEAAYETCKELLALQPESDSARERLETAARSAGSEEDLIPFLKKMVRSSAVAGTSLEAPYRQWFETLLANKGDWEGLVAELRQRASALATAAERVAVLDKLVSIQAEQLQDLAGAYRTSADILKLLPDKSERRSQLVRMADRAGMRGDIQTFVDELLSSAQVAGTPLEATYREWRLGILEEAGDWEPTISEYRARAQSATTAEEKVPWLEKVLKCQVEHLNAPGEAYETCKGLLTLQPSSDSARKQLEAAARSAGREEDLVPFAKKMLGSAAVAGTSLEASFRQWFEKLLADRGDWGALIAELRLKMSNLATVKEQIAVLDNIVKLQTEQLQDLAGAYETSADILLLAPDDSARRRNLVQVADEAGKKQALLSFVQTLLESDALAEGNLESTYEQLMDTLLADEGDWEGLLAFFRKRAAVATDLASQIEWLDKVCELQTTKLEDRTGAFGTMAAVLRLQPKNLELCESIIEFADQADCHGELLALLEEVVGLHGVAGTPLEEKYREFAIGVLSVDDTSERESLTSHLEVLRRSQRAETSLEAIRQLSKLYPVQKQWKESVAVLWEMASRVEPAEERLELLERAADIAFNELADDGRTEKILTFLLEAFPAHERSLGRLEQAMERQGRRGALKKFMLGRIKRAGTAEERASTTFRALQSPGLTDCRPGEEISLLLQIQMELPGHAESSQRLCRLLLDTNTPQRQVEKASKRLRKIDGRLNGKGALTAELQTAIARRLGLETQAEAVSQEELATEPISPAPRLPEPARKKKKKKPAAALAPPPLPSRAAKKPSAKGGPPPLPPPKSAPQALQPVEKDAKARRTAAQDKADSSAPHSSGSSNAPVVGPKGVTSPTAEAALASSLEDEGLEEVAEVDTASTSLLEKPGRPWWKSAETIGAASVLIAAIIFVGVYRANFFEQGGLGPEISHAEGDDESGSVAQPDVRQPELSGTPRTLAALSNEQGSPASESLLTPSRPDLPTDDESEIAKAEPPQVDRAVLLGSRDNLGDGPTPEHNDEGTAAMPLAEKLSGGSDSEDLSAPGTAVVAIDATQRQGASEEDSAGGTGSDNPTTGQPVLSESVVPTPSASPKQELVPESEVEATSTAQAGGTAEEGTQENTSRRDERSRREDRSAPEKKSAKGSTQPQREPSIEVQGLTPEAERKLEMANRIFNDSSTSKPQSGSAHQSPDTNAERKLELANQIIEMATNLTDQGKEAMAKGKWDVAMARFQDAKELSGATGEVRALIKKCRHQQERKSKEAKFKLYLDQGRSAMDKSRFEEAGKMFEKAAKYGDSEDLAALIRKCKRELASKLLEESGMGEEDELE